jgi:GMP synthase-like glutamine amidotransferase
VKITVLQHSQNTPPGLVLKWANARGLDLDIRHLYRGDPLPSSNDFDTLIVLGGPMNVDDVTENPWLIAEKELLRKTFAEGKFCLGLCLGGQLLAQAHGGTVTPHRHWEVGWHRVFFSDGSDLRFFQWHQDSFIKLPPSAELIAHNEITAHQGFRIKNLVLGLQFHPEATSEWIISCIDDKDFPEGQFVQSQKEIREQTPRFIGDSENWFLQLLDRELLDRKSNPI